MKEVSSWKELSIEMQKRIDKSLAKNVAPVIEKKVQQSAEINVSGNHSRTSKGIGDADCIVSEVNAGELTVIDIAKPQPPVWGEYSSKDETTFSKWVEYGEWMDLAAFIESGYTNKVKRAARPFIEPVQEDINNNPTEIFSALKKGLE